ncbi:MAG: type I restriction-modification system subunit M [Tannerella sp.]|jgi:type I restriction enzyme M protein|nr:type I restriction-modification system subunit M [Tannerella sp.]
MAKTGKSTEENLWQSANKLRGSVEPSEYKHVVLSLIFLKFISDTFEQRRAELVSEGKEQFLDIDVFYHQKNVFYLPEEARWSYIMRNAKQADVAIKIDTAMATIEKNNKQLRGALPDNYFSRLGLEPSKLAALLDTINNEDTLKEQDKDIVGRVYEYFLSKFAIAEGKGKGEFYTPKSIVNLIAELIEPYRGKIYDPCCGSGGMFIQSMKFVDAHKGNTKDIAVFGQEQINTTYKLAKMNLAIRGISANLGDVAADTFARDQHPDLKADFIMANPPFNLKDWRGSNDLIDDPRWSGYDVPPTSNANYAWILHIVSKLSENGTAGFLLANGALSGSGDEYKIRRKLVENDLIEAILVLPQDMFYTTNISVTLWIIAKNKKSRTLKQGGSSKLLRNRSGEILFMDLRQIGEPYEKKYIQFNELNIRDVAATFHTWQSNMEQYGNVPEYCYSASFDEIAAKDFSLVPSKYIEFVNRDESIDFDTKMQSLKQEFAELLHAEEQSKTDLLRVFKDLGYNIEL